MRITGGLARGIVLSVPRGEKVRPATDAMRQAVFSSIASWVRDSRFVDLFAGSGAYGLEALSRGAKAGMFVEKDARTADCIRENIRAVCKSLDRAEVDVKVVKADATTVLIESIPDLVFVDPPYELIPEIAPKLFLKLTELLIEKNDPLLIFEMPGELNFTPDGWTCVKRLGKGKNQPTVCIFRANRALI